MSAAYYPQVQKIYVAYYGRPADPAGLQYWAGQLAANGGNLTSIINAFGNSSESTALYAGASDSAKVTAIYQQLFNRAPDGPGLAFYTAELTAGRMTAASIALNVANGAQGTDLTFLNNKVTVGTAFTDALTVDGAAAVAYTGTTAITAARSLITGVTTSAATTNVASTITSIKSGGGATAGQTFTLTTDTQAQDFSANTKGVTVTVSGDDDATEGDEFDITLSGNDDTLIIDSYLKIAVDAGAGVDTLDLREFSGTLGAGNGDVNLATGVAHTNLAGTFRNFENIRAHEDGGRLVGTIGANSIWLNEGTDDISAGGGDDTIYADGDTLNAADDLDGGSGTDTLTIDGEDTLNIATAFDVLTGVENIVVTGTDDNDVTLTFDALFDSTSTSAIVGGIRNIAVQDIGAPDTVNTVKVTAGAASDSNLLGVTFTNVQAVTVDAAAGTNIVRIDSSTLNGVETLTGKATDLLTLSGGTYDFSNLTFKTITDIDGSTTKNDTVKFGSSIGTIDDVDLGASTSDEITFGEDVGDISAVTLAGVEKISFGVASSVVLDDAHAAVATSVVGTDGEDQLVFEGTGIVATDLSITGIETVVIDAMAANTATTFTIGASTLAAGVTIVGDSGTDTLKMGADNVDISKVTFKDYEAIDLSTKSISASIATMSGFGSLDGDNAGKVTLTDSGSLTLKNSAGVAGTFDIQGFSGADIWTLDTFKDAKGVDIKTGGGADTVIVKTNSTLTNTNIYLEGGDDTLDLSDTTEVATLANGGVGSDTILLSDTAVAATGLAATKFAAFETIKWNGADLTGISLALGATDVIVSTIDFSADTNSAGANTIDVSAANDNGMVIVGSAGVDTIKTTALGDTVNGGGGGDTIEVTGVALASSAEAKTYVLTGGAGNDTFKVLANAFTTGKGQHAVTVTDWTAGDTLHISAVSAGAAENSQGISQALVDAASVTTLTAAFDALSTNADSLNADQVYAFQFGGDTYVYVDLDQGAASYDATKDFYVKLSGLVTVDLVNYVSS